MRYLRRGPYSGEADRFQRGPDPSGIH